MGLVCKLIGGYWLQLCWIDCCSDELDMPLVPKISLMQFGPIILRQPQLVSFFERTHDER
jgi:hypothetical protein